MTSSFRHRVLESTQHHIDASRGCATLFKENYCIATRKMSSSGPFQRLLTFFSNGSPQITFMDSLRGDLSIGLDFPVALFLASIRHLVFRNTGTFSLNIHVPTVQTSRTLLGGPDRFNVDETKRYSVSELIGLARPGGVIAQADAFGLWALAAEKDGKVKGEEVRLFQRGEIMERIVERRKGRENVLPLWRGGPIIVGAHSWAVEKCFGVKVYQKEKQS